MRARSDVLAGGLLAALVLATLGVGSWWGFPVQDDTYLVRLMRLGGPERILRDHADRPIAGFLIAVSGRLAGENPVPYIAVSLAFWSSFAVLSVLFWRRVFPEWAAAWPAVALSVVAPLLAVIQFTTVTTEFQCLMPVLLLQASLFTLLGSADDETGWGRRAAGAVLAMAGASVSEYGLATAIAGGVFLLLRGRWRAMLTMLAGVAAGYAVFRAISNLELRDVTDPQIQLRNLLSHPWTQPMNIFSAAWYCVAGAWGKGIAAVAIELDSKSSLTAFAVALVLAAAGASIWIRRSSIVDRVPAASRVIALLGAVAAGLAPAVVMQGWPLELVYETRFMLPVVLFASCATVAALLAFARPPLQVLALSALCFVAGQRLVDRAFQERRIQKKLEDLGARVRPTLQETDGLVVLVTPEQMDQSAEETSVKIAYRWDASESNRFWVVRPQSLEARSGTRADCLDLSSVRLRAQFLRWPRQTDRISALIWDPGDRGPNLPAAAPVPYFLGCASR